MAFGQSWTKCQVSLHKENNNNDSGFNNIDNDLYNGKYEQIMKSIKSKSNGDEDE